MNGNPAPRGGRAVSLALLLLGLPAATGTAQGPNRREFLSPLQTRYVAITPSPPLTDTGLGTGGVTLRGGDGCNGIAAWSGNQGRALLGGVVNVGY